MDAPKIPIIPGATPVIPVPQPLTADEVLKRTSLKKQQQRLAKQAKERATNQTRHKRAHAKLHETFENLLIHHLPQIYHLSEREYQFSKWRYRFDYCWPCYMVAVDIQGGIYGGRSSGHTSISGMENDMMKINLAQSLGWVMLQLSPRKIQINPGYVVATLCQAIEIQRLRGVWR